MNQSSDDKSMPCDPPFSIMLAATHRKLRLWRCLEYAGRGMVVGCVTAILVAMILKWLGWHALNWVLSILFGGGLVGLVIGLFQRSSKIQVAMMIDQQFLTQDLFSTALVVNKQNPFEQPILQMANHYCQHIPTSRIVVRAWGSSQWMMLNIGTLLTIAACVLIGRTNILGSDPGDTIAYVDDNADMLGVASDKKTQAINEKVSRINSGQNEDAKNGNAMNQQPIAKEDGEQNSTGKTGHEDKTNVADANRTGAGGGQSETDKAAKERIPVPLVASDEKAVVGQSGKAEGINNGLGVASTESQNQNTNRRQPHTSNANSPRNTNAPWAVGDWKESGKAARLATQSSQQYSRYRELIRSYFDAE